MPSEESKAKLREAFRGAKSATVTDEGSNTIHIILGDNLTEVRKLIKEKVDAIHRAGNSARLPDGTRTFIDKTEIFDDGEYVWDKSGNKVKCRRFLVTVHPDGKMSKKFLGYSWVLVDNL